MNNILKGVLLSSAPALIAASAPSVIAAEYPKDFKFVYSAHGANVETDTAAKENIVSAFSMSPEQLKETYRTLDQIKRDFKDIREVGFEVSGEERYQLQMRYRESIQHPEFIRNIEFLVREGVVIDVQTFGYM